MRTVLICVPIRPFVIGSCRNLFIVGISAVFAGVSHNTLRRVRCRLGNNAVIKVMRRGLTFVADAETYMGIIIQLVDHPFAPSVICEYRDILRLGSFANGTGIEHFSKLGVRRRYVHNTVIPFAILDFMCITTTSSCMCSVAVGRPITPSTFMSRNDSYLMGGFVDVDIKGSAHLECDFRSVRNNACRSLCKGDVCNVILVGITNLEFIPRTHLKAEIAKLVGVIGVFTQSQNIVVADINIFWHRFFLS